MCACVCVCVFVCVCVCVCVCACACMHACAIEDVPLVEFSYLSYARCESYHMLFRCLSGLHHCVRVTSLEHQLTPSVS